MEENLENNSSINKIISSNGNNKEAWEELLSEINSGNSYTNSDIISNLNQFLINKTNIEITLDIIDFLVNYGTAPIVELIAKKEFLKLILELLKKSSNSNVNIQKKIIFLTQKWAKKYENENNPNYSCFIDNYNSLKKNGIIFPPNNFRLETYTKYITDDEVQNTQLKLDVMNKIKEDNKKSALETINNKENNFANPFSTDMGETDNIENKKIFVNNNCISYKKNINNDEELDNNPYCENNINNNNEINNNNNFNQNNNIENNFNNNFNNFNNNNNNSNNNNIYPLGHPKNKNNNFINEQNLNVPKFQSQITNNNNYNNNNQQNNNIYMNKNNNSSFNNNNGNNQFSNFNNNYNNRNNNNINNSFNNNNYNGNNNYNNRNYNNNNNININNNYNRSNTDFNNNRFNNNFNDFSQNNDTFDTNYFKQNLGNKLLQLNSWIDDGKYSFNSGKLKEGILEIINEISRCEYMMDRCKLNNDKNGYGIVRNMKMDIEQTCARYEDMINDRRIEPFISSFTGNSRKYYFNKTAMFGIQNNSIPMNDFNDYYKKGGSGSDSGYSGQNNNYYEEKEVTIGDKLSDYGNKFKEGLFFVGGKIKDTAVSGFNFVKEKINDKKDTDDA